MTVKLHIETPIKTMRQEVNLSHNRIHGFRPQSIFGRSPSTLPSRVSFVQKLLPEPDTPPRLRKPVQVRVVR